MTPTLVYVVEQRRLSDNALVYQWVKPQYEPAYAKACTVEGWQMTYAYGSSTMRAYSTVSQQDPRRDKLGRRIGLVRFKHAR